MKKIIILSILILLLSGCGSEKNEVNILNWSSYIPDEVLRDFERETGIKVNYNTYSSNEECLAKLQAAKSGTYDLVFPSDYLVELLIQKEMIQKLDKTKLNNIDNLNPNYLNLEYDTNNEYSLPFLAASVVIIYDEDFVNGEIDSYDDLLNPKYKNNIVLLDDQRIIIGMALLALGYDMNDTNDNHIEEAKEWLLTLKPNIKAFDSDSPKTFMITKETKIGVIWNAEAGLAMNELDSLKVVYPEEGFNISVDNFTIPVNAKNLDNAYKFIDYILRADVMQKIIEDYPYKNMNLKTQELLSDTYLNNIATNIPDDYFKKGIFVKNIGESIVKYDKVWASIK